MSEIGLRAARCTVAKALEDACIIDRLAKQQAIITVINIHPSHHLSDVSLAKSLQLIPGNSANFRLFMICSQISE